MIKNRRSFLQLIGVAPAAAAMQARALEGEVFKSAGIRDVPANMPIAGAVGMQNPIVGNFADQLVRGVAPEWVMSDIRASAYWSLRDKGLDPDIAVLRSVSPAAKISIHVDRYIAQTIRSAKQVSLFDRARQMFFQNMHDERAQ